MAACVAISSSLGITCCWSNLRWQTQTTLLLRSLLSDRLLLPQRAFCSCTLFSYLIWAFMPIGVRILKKRLQFSHQINLDTDLRISMLPSGEICSDCGNCDSIGCICMRGECREIFVLERVWPSPSCGFSCGLSPSTTQALKNLH